MTHNTPGDAVGTAQNVDQVKLKGFTPLTQDFLSKRFEEGWGHDYNRWVPFDFACGLWFKLRATPETEFPSGKWATLQVLEACIDSALGRTP